MTTDFLNGLKEKESELIKSINYLNLILESVKELLSYERDIINNTFDGVWEIKNVNTFYFFQHSEDVDYAIDKIGNLPICSWVDNLGINKLGTRHYKKNGKSMTSFGFYVDESYGKEIDINLDEKVLYVKKEKMFIYKSKLEALDILPVNIHKRILKKTLEIIKRLNFKYAMMYTQRQCFKAKKKVLVIFIE
ncbi:MAG: hypothetical protein ACK5LV_00055 [Lachnospirales bacterium]